MSAWQPIATAPKDKIRILVYEKHYSDISIAYWASEGYWLCLVEGQKIEPTHWMPLPEPPASNL